MALVRRIVLATANYGVGGFLPKLVSFLLIPVFTSYLTPADYGLLEIAGAFGAILAITMKLGIPGAVARFYYEYAEGSALRDYVTTVSRFLMVTSVLAGVAGLWISWTAGDRLLPGLPFFPEAVLVVVSTIAASQSDLQRRLIQAREQSRYSAVLSICLALFLTCISLVLVVVIEWGPTGVLFAQALTGVIGFLIAVSYLRFDLKGRFRFSLLRGSIGYAAGVLPSHIIGAVVPLVQRIILVSLGSLASLGHFSIAFRFVLPLDILASAFTNAYLPVYFSVRKNGGASGLVELADVGHKIWVLAVGATLGVALMGPPLIVLMTPTVYHSAVSLVGPLSLGFLGQILYLLIGPEIFYAKKTWAIPFVSAANGLVSLGITLVFVSDYGALALAWALPCGQITAAIIASQYARRSIHIPHQWGKWTRAGAIAALLYFMAAMGVKEQIVGEGLPAEILTSATALILFGAYVLTVLQQAQISDGNPEDNS